MAAWLIAQHAIAHPELQRRERPPQDWHARQREIEAWRERVGWRE